MSLNIKQITFHLYGISKTLFLFILLLFMSWASLAQPNRLKQDPRDIKLEALPYYSFGKGVGLTSPDSIFQFNIRFRMQSRVTFYSPEDEESSVDAVIRRLRLRFDGYVGDPKFVYVIQLSFSPEDVGLLRDETNLNIIRDAIFFYRPNNAWNLGFGITKLPGNRQRVNSSGALELTDRTINNGRFNIDRDFGFHIYYLHESENNLSYNIKTAISTGEGRNWKSSPDMDFAYTGRLELYPLGTFIKNGAYFESDLMRESSPKIMISGTYNYNKGAQRTRGTIGDALFEKRDLNSVLLDLMAKYNGWAFMAAYMNRNTDNPITTNPDDASETRNIFTGDGFDLQLSYIFKNDLSLITRYSEQSPYDKSAPFSPKTTQLSLGVTKYIWQHTFKIQAELSNDHLQFSDNSTENLWYLRFQIELGI